MTSPGRLRWRCRRGVLELDLLLLRYLEHGYERAAPAERQAFRQLLEMEDLELQSWLLGDLLPADDALAAVIRALRR